MGFSATPRAKAPNSSAGSHQPSKKGGRLRVRGLVASHPPLVKEEPLTPRHATYERCRSISVILVDPRQMEPEREDAFANKALALKEEQEEDAEAGVGGARGVDADRARPAGARAVARGARRPPGGRWAGVRRPAGGPPRGAGGRSWSGGIAGRGRPPLQGAGAGGESRGPGPGRLGPAGASTRERAGGGRGRWPGGSG